MVRLECLWWRVRRTARSDLGCVGSEGVNLAPIGTTSHERCVRVAYELRSRNGHQSPLVDAGASRRARIGRRTSGTAMREQALPVSLRRSSGALMLRSEEHK